MGVHLPGLTRFHEQLINYVEPQGVVVSRTTDGLRFKFPNGKSDAIHFTQSDYRATRNTRANFRRNGIEWPGDARGGKKQVKNPSPKTLAAVEAAVAGKDDLSITDVATATGISFYAVQGALVKLGWWRDYGSSRSSNVRWHPPLEDPKAPAESMVIEPADDDADQPDPTPPAEREFLDTHDSWTVDVDAVEAITMGDLRAAYQAAGLAFEVRVWKA